MNPETLKILTTEIVAQTIAENWVFWAVLACLSFLLSATGAFLGGYIRKRAEQAALVADFDAVKKQLHESTALTESIKTEIKHLAERSEKIRWLKQEKLEQYIVHVLSVVDYYSAEMYRRFFDAEPPKGDDPWKTATMLQTLYLPELATTHAALSGVLGNFQNWVAAGMQQRITEMKMTGQKQLPSNEHCERFSNHLAILHTAIHEIQVAAQKLAIELTKA